MSNEAKSSVEGIFSSFDARRFAFNHGMFVQLEWNKSTGNISKIEGAINESKTYTHIHQLLSFCSVEQIDEIITFLNKLSYARSITKISFSLVNETQDSQILHNLYIAYPKIDQIQCNLSVIPTVDERFSKLVFVSAFDDIAETYVPKQVFASLSNNFSLQNYQYDVLRFLVQGYTSETTASVLGLSTHTVNDYKKQLFDIFNANTIYQLIRHAREKEII